MTEETLQAQVSQEPAQFDAYRSTLRLLVGLALVSGDGLVARLREWEAAHPVQPAGPAGVAEGARGTASGSDLARGALIGLVFEGAEAARQLVLGAAGLSVSFTHGLVSVFKPVTDSLLFRPFKAPFRALASRGEDRLARYVRTGRAEGPRSRQLADEVTGLLIEDVVDYMADNRGVLALVDAQVKRLLPELVEDPAVQALVDAQVKRLLPALVDDPVIQALLVEQLGTWVASLAARAETLDPLVQEVGNRYIAYLNEHPDDVQNLVQGQAAGMAGEVRDSVRAITVTGDSVLETLARNLLRRTPRSDLPPPPPEVRRQADPGAIVDHWYEPEAGA